MHHLKTRISNRKASPHFDVSTTDVSEIKFFVNLFRIPDFYFRLVHSYEFVEIQFLLGIFYCHHFRSFYVSSSALTIESIVYCLSPSKLDSSSIVFTFFYHPFGHFFIPPCISLYTSTVFFAILASTQSNEAPSSSIIHTPMQTNNNSTSNLPSTCINRTHSALSTLKSMSSLPPISHLVSNTQSSLDIITPLNLPHQHLPPVLRPPKRLSATQLHPTPLPLPLSELKIPPPQPSNPLPRALPDRARTPATQSSHVFAKRMRRVSSIASSSTGNLPDLAINSSTNTTTTSILVSNNQQDHLNSSSPNGNSIASSPPTNMSTIANTTLRTHRRRASECSTFYTQVKKNNSTIHTTIPSKKRLIALDEFRLGKMLGTGATATVIKAEPIPGTNTANVIPSREVALKVISRKGLSKRAAFYLQREISIHRLVQTHPNIATLYDVFEDSQHIYIAVEMLKGSDLYTVLKRERHGLHERIALFIIIQVLDALQFMHSQGYSHRDIKPENIMFAEKPNFNEGKYGSVRLIDFGLACARDPKKQFKDRMSSEKCGTIRYAAPEIITQASYIPEFVDMWSIGVVLYSIIAHRNPYTGRTEREVLHETQNSPLSFESVEWKHVSEDTKELICNLLSKKPTDRPTAAKAHQEAIRILQMISKDRIDISSTSQNSSLREQERVTPTVAGFPSNVTPEGTHSSRRSDKPGNGRSGSAPSRSNSENGNGQQPSFIDGVIAWFSGSSPDRARSENSN